ncbi:phosphatase PAP2 family protein [Shewanella sp. NIFS-20-20]|uniref:phosphatase PAP2 family protein n=1 Tax=Shewanella sp. NIFS-20-20 TaxID=2853806 RepID=UPI001C447532|nr:phosphatase PAP2 family protein [Shewanella sp. NIFS-20-20]MBV7316541.1 phosphatase PAP2 family protein [Shewanella sp. NIFS-20-20]
MSNQPPSVVSEYWRWLIAPSLVFMILASVVEVLHVDLMVADALYQWQGGPSAGGWTLRDGFIEETLLHKGLHNVVVVFAIGLLVMCIASFRRAQWRRYRIGLLYLLLCFTISTLIVATLKKYTHVNCPWDLIPYGGSQIFVPNFARLPADVAPGRCFPGGHASGGYGWLGIFFVALVYRPRWRYPVLLAVLAFGGVMDIAQQLRGAHFMSHGLWTLAISWWVSATLYFVMLRRQRRRPQ